MFEDTSKLFYYNYDCDSISYKYGRLGGPSGWWCPGKYGAKTTGSSVTINAAAGTPFDPVNIGDVILFIVPPEVKYIRKVVTKPSGAQITVDTAVDLGTVGVPFEFMPFRIGATVNDGWHATQMYTAITLWLQFVTVAAGGGIDVTIEGKADNNLLGPAETVTLLTPATYTVAGTESINIGEVVGAVRVGVKGHTDFTGTDVFSIWLTGEMRAR